MKAFTTLGDGIAAFGLLMKSLFWPLSLNVSYAWPNAGLLTPYFLLGFFSLIGVILIALFNSKKAPLISFGLLVFVLAPRTHAVTAYLVPGIAIAGALSFIVPTKVVYWLDPEGGPPG